MRVFSGIKPTGAMQIGNYVGALRQWVAEQHRDAFYCVVDLHALTIPIDPAEVRDRTVEAVAGLLAVGIDPERATLFVQSHVAEHARLNWLLECVVAYGELRRMTQFKEKADAQGGYRAGLLTYPVLMAADILLYDTVAVPVGDDQRQHVELCRTIAERFNARYGPTFTVPEAVLPKTGFRIMDLQDPTKKMSKSEVSPQGTLTLFEPPEELRRKIARAVTDTDNEVRYDPKKKPGVSNLLQLFGSLTGESPEAVAARYHQYGPLKSDLADCVIETLSPLRARYLERLSDRSGTLAVLRGATERARAVASATYERAADAMGLLR